MLNQRVLLFQFSLLLASLVTTSIGQSYPTSYDYILADLDRCRTESPDVLLWINSRTNSHIRPRVRNTLGNQHMWPDNIKVITVFFSGKPSEAEIEYQSLLEYEFELYRDIVQTDFIEDYKNLTLKLISAINYISDHCKELKLILKVDEDVVFHPKLMLNELVEIMSTPEVDKPHSLKSKLRFIQKNSTACNILTEYSILRKSSSNSFYAVEDNVLLGLEYYPPFCAGFFVAMSGNVPSMVKPYIATNGPFWIDDSYMGVLLEKASAITIDMSDRLDFGYSDITRESLELILNRQVLARHLPRSLHLHLAYIFDLLELSLTSAQSVIPDTFNTIYFNTHGVWRTDNPFDQMFYLIIYKLERFKQINGEKLKHIKGINLKKLERGISREDLMQPRKKHKRKSRRAF